MSNDSPNAPQLPERPNLRHLKDQAKDLLRTGGAVSLSDAQFQIARLYGFSSWPTLKAHVESLLEIGQLKQAIDSNDLDSVKAMMTRNPGLHRAALGYGKDGPLTWVAECRVPWEPPSPARLAMARWMIENGSDVHQGGDGPLMRAALQGYRIPMMELLVSLGADVNAWWHGTFPIAFAPCETLDAEALEWLLGHGADTNCKHGPAAPDGSLRAHPGTALDYCIGTYLRSPEDLAACIDILIKYGGVTKYAEPALLALLMRKLDLFSAQLDANPDLINRRFPDFDFGASAGRTLTLKGATLLHVAAEYGYVDAVRLLLDLGADVNARAAIDEAGIGGQTPIFHAASQNRDAGLPAIELLVQRGTDLSIRAKLPGHYERPDEVVECTPLGYALLFPGVDGKTVAFLRAHDAPE